MTVSSDAATRGRSRADPSGRPFPQFVRRETPWLASLVAVSALAIAQPVLSKLSSDPTIFQGRASSKMAIVMFALLVTFAPPVTLWIVELAARRVSEPLRMRFHAVFLAALSWALFIQVGKNVDALGPTVVLVVALGAGIGVAVLYTRFELVRRWLTYLSPFALFVIVSFLFLSPVWSFVTAGGTPTAAAVGTDTDVPVVVVVLDELGTSALLDGEGFIDADLFPNLARLAGDATWYRNTTTVGPHTPLALSAVLTGQYPPTDLAEATVSSNYDGSLFSLLSESHVLNAYEPFTRFCTGAIGCEARPATSTGDELSTLVDLGRLVFEESIDPSQSAEIPLNVAVRDDGDPGAYLDSFIESLDAPSDGPRLDFIHVLLPHTPYRLLPSGLEYNAPRVPEAAASWQGPWPDDDATWGARQRHLLQAQYADAQLGRLLDELEKLDRYEESLIVVTADHGSAFVTGEPSRDLTAGNATHIAWVPLVVKAPGQTDPVVVDTPVENIDILPAIAEILGVDIPWDTDGLVPGSRTDDVAHVVPWAPADVPWATRVLRGTDDTRFIELDRAKGLAGVLAAPTMGIPSTPARWRAYQRGPYAGLVGLDVDEVAIDERSAPGVLDQPTNVRSEPGPTPRPVYVTGRVEGSDRGEVAVVVDGLIAAVLPTHPDLGNRFWGLVPESVLQEGDNTFEAYLVTGGPDDVTLSPLERP